MGIDVHLCRGDVSIVELPSYRTASQRDVWTRVLADVNVPFHENSRIPFQAVYAALESQVARLTRDEILAEYLDGNYAEPVTLLRLYRVLHEYKSEPDLVIQFC
jgi:hypothetical protein